MDEASRVRRDAAVLLVASVFVLAPIAWWTFGVGTLEFRYSLAGWAAVYGLVPEWTIGVGVLISLILAGVMLVVHHRRRSTPTHGRLRWRWWFILVAAWAGYFSGAAVIVAGGGPVESPSALRMELGEPIGETVQVEATCRSVVGEPDSIAEIRSSDVHVALRSMPLGGPAYEGPRFSLTRLPPDAELVPQGVRERPAIIREWLDAGGRVTGQDEFSFYEAYSMTLVRSWESKAGSSGNATFHMSRLAFQDTSWVRFTNAVVADDPWPPEVDLTVSWTCGQGAAPSA